MPQKRKRHKLEPGNWKLESGTKILIKILTQKKKRKKKEKEKKNKQTINNTSSIFNTSKS